MVGCRSIRNGFADVSVVDPMISADDEHRRHGDVVTLHRDTIREGGLEVGIRQEGKRDALFRRQIHGVGCRVDAHGDEGHALRVEVTLSLRQLTELAAAIRSPVAAIEKQYDRTPLQKIGERNVVAFGAGERKIGR